MYEVLNTYSEQQGTECPWLPSGINAQMDKNRTGR